MKLTQNDIKTIIHLVNSFTYDSPPIICLANLSTGTHLLKIITNFEKLINWPCNYLVIIYLKYKKKLINIYQFLNCWLFNYYHFSNLINDNFINGEESTIALTTLLTFNVVFHHLTRLPPHLSKILKEKWTLLNENNLNLFPIVHLHVENKRTCDETLTFKTSQILKNQSQVTDNNFSNRMTNLEKDDKYKLFSLFNTNQMCYSNYTFPNQYKPKFESFSVSNFGQLSNDSNQVFNENQRMIELKKENEEMKKITRILINQVHDYEKKLKDVLIYNKILIEAAKNNEMKISVLCDIINCAKSSNQYQCSTLNDFQPSNQS